MGFTHKIVCTEINWGNAWLKKVMQFIYHRTSQRVRFLITHCESLKGGYKCSKPICQLTNISLLLMPMV